jgi:predicted AlkP superfamily pyrophosphatase or phosphodiesterase
MRVRRIAATVFAALAFAGLARTEEARHALMVSVDGLMPAYYLRADELGMRIPNLRRLMAEGSYGRVTGVLPSVTYPSHTTLITGVPPRVHGIVSNTVFDPEGRSSGAWTWYGSWVRVPTLVSAARLSRLTTASVSWPVTVGLEADQVVPEFWRSGSQHASDVELIAALSTRGLLAGAARERGRPFTYPMTDQDRTDVALYALRRHHPRPLLLHLVEVDNAQHDHGPLSAEAKAAVERSDAELGRLARVRSLFSDAGKPGSGILRVLEPPDIERLGGDSEAALVLDADAGFSFSGAPTGEYLGPSRHAGTHGYGPDREEMQAALVMAAPGVRHGDLGMVRMTTIAPTVARFLGMTLGPQADEPLPAN